MYVLHAWKSSLQLFKPSNLKLFALVTLKNTINTYKNYFKYGWPFLLAAYAAIGLIAYMKVGIFALRNQIMVAGASDAVVVNAFLDKTFEISVVVILLLGPLTLLCRFLATIFARPSVDKKNCAYMRTYLKRYWWRVILQALLFWMLFLLVKVLSVFLYLYVRYGFTIAIRTYRYWSYTSFYADVVDILNWVINIFSLFFLFDLERSFRSLFVSVWFGIKMAFYNLPFVIITSIVLMPVNLYVMRPLYINILMYPLIFCFIGTYYTKKVHDQARLYQGN